MAVRNWMSRLKKINLVHQHLFYCNCVTTLGAGVSMNSGSGARRLCVAPTHGPELVPTASHVCTRSVPSDNGTVWRLSGPVPSGLPSHKMTLLEFKLAGMKSPDREEGGGGTDLN